MGLVKTRRLAAMQKHQKAKAEMRPPLSKTELNKFRTNKKDKIMLDNTDDMARIEREMNTRIEVASE